MLWVTKWWPKSHTLSKLSTKFSDSILQRLGTAQVYNSNKINLNQSKTIKTKIVSLLCRIDRECTREINYEKVNIKKGMIVTVPIYALHHLEEYWPEPEKFDPERWSPENKSKRNPYAYMPFGMGPRNCVGMRFAVEELKLAICDLVRKFRFFPVPETPVYL